MKTDFDGTVIIVNNLKTMKAFYTGLLGFEIKHDFGGCIILKQGVSLWKTTSDHIITSHNQNSSNKGNPIRFELCFSSDNFDEVAQAILSNQVVLLHPVREEAWGQRTFRFFDPEGNLIEMGESLKAFSLRLYQKGLSLQEVADKTGIPIELLNSFIS